MELDKIFTSNDNDIILENFEDEIVAINLKTGFYFSIRGMGIEVWELLMKKISPAQVIRIYKKVYPGSEMEKSLQQFIMELDSEGFLIPLGNESAEGVNIAELTSVMKAANGTVPEKPVLEKYTDQQELLLLDPIHEVSELGWPEKKKQEPENE